MFCITQNIKDVPSQRVYVYGNTAMLSFLFLHSFNKSFIPLPHLRFLAFVNSFSFCSFLLINHLLILFSPQRIRSSSLSHASPLVAVKLTVAVLHYLGDLSIILRCSW